jgi:hypothetical protein
MAHCRVEERDFRGWQAAYLKNDLITLAAVPDIGGRIMAYDLGPYPYLYVDRQYAGQLFTPEENQGDGSLAAWKNYGGDKTWPAPQGWVSDDQWHGPPDPILDTGHYRLEALRCDGTAATVKMVSPATSATGVQIIRQATIHADSSRVMLDLSFRNVTQRTVRWSIWDVVQLNAERRLPDGILAPDTGCVVTAPINPDSRFDEGFTVMFGDPNNPQWRSDKAAGLFVGDYQWEIGKVGLDSRAGWAAFANTSAQQAFALRYTPFPDQDYPDDGAAVEFWTVGRGQVANLDYEKSAIYLMEVEVLSPFQHIEPEQRVSFRIEWGVCRCPGPIVDVTEGGCAGRKLQVTRNGNYAHLTGAFGVFDRGQLNLEWLDRAGGVLEPVALGPVSPLGMVALDQLCAVPPAATQVQLIVSNGTRRLLARAAL